MGNSVCCQKCLRRICPGEKETDTLESKITYRSQYEYIPRTLQDLQLKRGDLLEVLEETANWCLVKKRTGDKSKEATAEKGYVPKKFIVRLNSLESEPWYFGSVTKRTEAKRCLLRRENGEGAFLMWRSEKNQLHYLSIKNGDVTRHYKIEEADGSFYLVAHKKFSNLSDLVESYSKDQGGLCVKLGEPCVMLERPDVSTLSYAENWEVEKSSLKKTNKLGSGEFGEVWQGVWNNTIEVAIKEFKVKNPDILNEITIMKNLNHKRLLNLYAVCTLDEPICIITELMKNGSLYTFLRDHNELKDIEFSLMMDFATQIAEGMGYLETKNVIHRDLRADNILLTEIQSCKIADFGLAKFIISGGQEIQMSEKVPIKWMAPEVFSGAEYTIASDVWSFGILLTEIVTYGEEPYPGKDNVSCIGAIQKGYRMAKPTDCPQSLYDIMLLCWSENPSNRPGFTELQEKVLTLITEPDTELE